MKRTICFAVVAALTISGAIFAKSYIQMKNAAGDLFEANLEALADREYELAPGEEDNCVSSAEEHCIYSYGGRNYNIERSKNKF